MSSFSAAIAQKTLIKLIIVQWGFVVILGLSAWIIKKPKEDAIQKIEAITVEQHHDIEVLTEELIPNGALIEENHRQAEFFLYMLAEGTNWSVNELRPITRIPEKGIVPTDYRLVMTGDPFNLPVFFDGIYRQPSIAMIQSVELHMRQRGDAKVIIRIRYFQPEKIEMPSFLTDGLGGNTIETIQKGWELWIWRDWKKQAEELRAEELKRRRTLQHELAKPIISLRNKQQGELLWSEVGGLQVRE